MDEDEHHKEVYAYFGLAMYMAQVLEVGVVNALVVCDLIPTRRNKVISQEQWNHEVDKFMDDNFKNTMAKLIKSLKKVKIISPMLEKTFELSVEKRNFLVHHYFRNRSEKWLTENGREEMIEELHDIRNIFKESDVLLSKEIESINLKYGFSEEKIKADMEEMIKEALERLSEKE